MTAETNDVVPTEPGMPEIGSILSGRYRILKMLGAGGMGWVFEGVHERLRRPIAIKVLKPALANQQEFQVRFEREARAAALLKSPHVVRVFDVDVMPDGAGMYIVMELLAGRDLAKEAALKSGLLDARDVVDWIAQSCDALHEAHENGIIHRDIKPGNIFLSDEGGGDRIAKLVDFGISKFSEHVTQRALTDPGGSVLGTPHYMAPEQLRGHRIDGRADIWALGITLYRILGGRLPFGGTSAAKGARADVSYMSSVLTESAHPFGELRPDLPRGLAPVIMKTLEKRPDDRYASAAELGRALRPFGRRASSSVIAAAAPAAAPAAALPTPPPAEPTTIDERSEESRKRSPKAIDERTVTTPIAKEVEPRPISIVVLAAIGVLAAVVVAGVTYGVYIQMRSRATTIKTTSSSSASSPSPSPTTRILPMESASGGALVAPPPSTSASSNGKQGPSTKPPSHHPSASAAPTSSSSIPPDFVPDHL